MNTSSLPVIVIGAGPVGLAAAANLLRRGLQPVVLEAGESAGSALTHWSQVRMFSPWEYNIDPASRDLLEAQGWQAPAAELFPTGGDLLRDYLLPLAAVPAIAAALRTGARVVAVSRRGRDRMKSAQREQAPFLVRYHHKGEEHELLAQAVIDASGTLGSPNPLGSSGLPALGEQGLAAAIDYGLPDVRGRRRADFAGRRVLVVGSGHSAFNMLADLVELARTDPNTKIHWAVRRPSLARVFGGGELDQLKERGRLGLRIRALVESGAIHLHTDTAIDALRQTADGIVARSADKELPAVDRIIGCTGFRPDLTALSELRLGLDPTTESPTLLAPMIDPNEHSCGTVRPHGVEQLAHPEPGFYIVGMKSYGRAPTFLLRTGYEQVRSVVAALAGDWEAARRVELVLPETGVCNTSFGDEAEDEQTAAGCCGGPAPASVSACCVADAVAKDAGKSGCGCPAKAA